MFREVRRNKQLLPMEDTVAVLGRGTNGTLACAGDDGYPYAVPLSYVYHRGKIYYHSAKSGHKVDAIRRDPKVSFTVVDEDTIVSAEYTTYFRSAIAFVKARIVAGDEWFDAFRVLVEKYSGDQPEEHKMKEIRGCGQSVIIAIDIEHLTGKEAIEYVRAKEGKDKV